MSDAAVLPGRVLVLGMGYGGRELARQLQADGSSVSGTVRDPAAAPDDGIARFRLDGVHAPEPALLEALVQADAVLCSVPPDADGDPALRWLLPTLRRSERLRWMGYLSSTAVYGDRDGAWIDERAAADGVTATALQRRMAEDQWRDVAASLGAASAVFRLPALYGRGRNALVQLAQGRARHVVRPGLVFNRLHVADLATAIIAAMRRADGAALYLPTDDEPAPPQDVLAFAARLSGLPMPPAQAWDDPDIPASLRRFYASNKRIDGRGTRERLQWQLRYPTYREGLQDAWMHGDGRQSSDQRIRD